MHGVIIVNLGPSVCYAAAAKCQTESLRAPPAPRQRWTDWEAGICLISYSMTPATEA